MKIFYSSLFFLLFIITAHNNLLSENIKKTIKVGVYDNPPKIFTDKKGNPDGIFIDIIKSIAAKEKFQIEYIIDDWNNLMTMLYNAEIDVLPDIAYSHERDSLFCLSKLPVLESWLEIFTKPSVKINSLVDLHNKRIGVLKGSIQEKYLKKYVKNIFNINFETYSYNSYSEKIQAFKNNETDFIIADRFFYYSDFFNEEISATTIILRPTQLHFAFNKNSGIELAKIFDKNISVLKNKAGSDYYKSLNKWLDKHYKKWAIIYVFIAFIIVSVFAIILKYKVKSKTKKLKIKNKELLIAIEKAKESDKFKSVFLANMSHEIRTPMNGILGFLELIKDPELTNDDLIQYIDIIKKSVLRLLNTINDIIEISKIESNQVNINITETNVNDIIHFCFEFFKQQANEKELNFEKNNLIPSEKFIIKTDKNKVECILTNLINNAIKFTPKGKIIIGSYIENDLLIFYVNDTGIGISPDKFNIIFDRFIQINTDIRTYEGSGLGLSIAKAYVELLGGKIWVKSEPGKGSSFYFSIPYNNEPE